MKKLKLFTRLGLAAGSCVLFSPAALEAQTVISGGGNYISGGSFYLGTHSGSPSGLVLTYDDAAADGVKLHSNRIASWLWENYDGTTIWPSMRLDQANNLILYNGSAEGVKLDPVNRRLTLGANANGTLTADANGVITAGGAFTATGGITSTNGALTGGATGLAFNAGAANQNISFTTPAGVGDIIFSTNGAERARIKSTGKVGIATTDPLEKLHIKGSLMIESAASTTQWRFLPEPTLDDRILQFENGSSRVDGGFTFKATYSGFNAVRLKINNDGKIGVGTASPTQRLHIYGGAVFNQTAAGLAYYYGGNADGATNAKYSGIGMGSGGHITFNSATDALAPTEYARFTPTGRLGLGTAAPATNLHIKTPATGHTYARLESVDGGNFIQFQRGATVYNSIASPYAAPGDFAIFDNVNNATRLYINPTGKVGVGTSNPQTNLQIADLTAGSSAQEMLNLQVAYTPNSAQKALTWRDGTNITGQIDTRYNGTSVDMVFGHLYNGGYTTGDILTIKGDGKVGIGTTSPSNRLTVGQSSGGTGYGGTSGTGGVRVAWSTGYGVSLDAWDGGTPRWGIVRFVENVPTVVMEGKHNSNDVIFNGGGNVGIGTTSPKELLHLAKAGVGSGDNQLLKLQYDMNAGGGTYIGFAQTSASNAYSKAMIGYQATGGSYGANGNLLFAINNAGTDTPVTATDAKLVIMGNGNVGIGTGTTTPASKLHVLGVGRFGLNDVNTNNMGGILVASGTGVGGARQYWIGASDPTAHNNNQFQISDYNGTTNSPLVTIYGMHMGANGGNVGIGTTNPTHKLAVAGTIRAYEVIVDTGWADYVFEEDYRLAPLSEVESHIKAKKHLPGIPSAAEVAEHGVSMGDMQAKLLSKVEELTLHLIRMEKENEALRQRVQILEKAR